jgi:hypothetical protein
MDWSELEHELDSWGAAGREATFWWRDDDARTVAAPLEKLLAVSEATETPLAIAVIPAGCEKTLAQRLSGSNLIGVLQHGFDHANHAPPGEKRTELGDHRPRDQILAQLHRGREKLTGLFAQRALPVLVPPWNRVGTGLVPALPDHGFRGISTFGPRKTPEFVSGLRTVNAHVDIVDWRGDRGFVGVAAALEQAVEHLRRRRTNSVDGTEPTGLLTHHLVLDDAGWQFTADFLERTGAHPAARWIGADALFGIR